MHRLSCTPPAAGAIFRKAPPWCILVCGAANLPPGAGWPAAGEGVVPEPAPGKYQMILFRYTIREHLLPFVYAFAIIIFFMVMNLAVQLLDRIISRGLDPAVILELFLIQMGWIVALAVPMAVLVSTLTTFGRMSADNEILAIKAAGRNMFYLMTPVLLAGAILALLLVYFNNLILPDANHRAANLTRDISRKKPAAFIEPGVLIRDFTNYVLYVDKVNPRTGRLEGIKVFSSVPGQDPGTTVADSGFVSVTDDGRYLRLILLNGESHSINAHNTREHRIAAFERQTIFIENVDDNLHRTESGYRSDREKSAQHMLADIEGFRQSRRAYLEEHNRTLDALSARLRSSVPDSLHPPAALPADPDPSFTVWAARHSGGVEQARARIRKEVRGTARFTRNVDSQDRKIAAYLVEVHKKYAIPVTAIAFVLIGAPLGIMARRGGLVVGGSYSVFFFVLFWVFLIGGERLADDLVISPVLAMWGGPALVGAFGLVLVVRMMRETTFISFGPLVRVQSWLGAHVPRGLRSVCAIPARLFSLLFCIPRLLARVLFKTLPVYLAGTFLRYLVGLTAALGVVFVIVDYISNLRQFEGVPPAILAQYYWYFFPWIVLIVLPIVLLLATMFSIGELARHSEITAMRGAGIGIRQLTGVLLLLGAGLAAGSFYFGEMVLPQANENRRQLADDIRDGRLERRGATATQPGREFRRTFFYFGNPSTIYCFEEFRTQPQRSRNVWRETFEGNRVVRRVQARSLDWTDSVWVFHDGTERFFTPDSSWTRSFDTYVDTVLHATPDEMVVRIKSKEEMSYWELRRFIDMVHRRGEKVSQYSAELYFKIALPVMNLIVILLGVSITARMGRKGGAALFGVGLGLTFSYWVIARFSLALAQNGHLPPLAGAWFGNVLFALLGLVLYARAIR